MFFKQSRYTNETTEVTPDAKGRWLKSVPLRITPKTSGSFRHTLTEGDRLDHLAGTYYQTPQKWWLIADANPEFLSPLELMGEGAFQTVRVDILNGNAPHPPWSELIHRLTALAGIEDVQVNETFESPSPSPSRETVTAEATVVILYNRLTLKENELITVITDAGFCPGQPHRAERTGKKIIIPEDGA